MARDTKSLTISRFHEIEDCDPLTEDLKNATRRAICANAVGATVVEQVADAELLMHMLGVFPGEEDLEYTVAPATRLNAGKWA